MWYVWKTGELLTGFWWGDHFEDLGVEGRIIMKCIFKEWFDVLWTGLIWLRIRTDGGRL
jgi:hypothetical protein